MKIRLALDWTPNTNHTGFFVALEKGYYQEVGLDVSILSVADDNYQTTPAKKVELGMAELALCPTESLLSYQTKKRPFDMVAIGAVYQSDLSAIVVREASGIMRPADLDRKTYASYEARYEDAIVKQMIINDGGEGTIVLQYPNKLKIWPEFLEGKSDATWIFSNWEGSLASVSGASLRSFKLSDFNIPYSYSPVIAGSEQLISTNESFFAKFMEASKKGFDFCRQEPKVAAELLVPHVPPYDQHIDLLSSQLIANEHYGGGNWGRLDPDLMQQFLDWLYQHQLTHSAYRAEQLIKPVF